VKAIRYNLTNNVIKSKDKKYKNQKLSLFKPQKIAQENFFNCILYNCRSVRNKIEELFSNIKLHNFSCICLTETWCSDLTFSNDELSMGGKYQVFTTHRINPKNKRGGGVAILLSYAINAKIILSSSIYQCEILILEIQINSGKIIRLCDIYRPPNTSLENSKKILKYLNNFITTNFIMVGDLNYSTIDWFKLTSIDNIGENFLEFIYQNNFKQFVTEFTRKNRILDLCISNSPDLISSCSVTLGLSNSDHYGVLFRINQILPNNNNIIYIRDFSKINVNCLNFEFLYLTPDKFTSFYNINDKYKAFIGAILYNMDMNVPFKKVDTKKLHCNYHYPRFLEAAIKEKSRLWKFNRFNDNMYIDKYKKLCLYIRSKIYELRNKYISSISTNTSKIHKYIRSKTKALTQIPALKANNTLYTTNSEKCELFADTFEKTLNNKTKIFDITYSDENSQTIEDIDFSVITVLKLLKSLPNKDGSSPDYIGNKILKKCYQTLTIMITELFRISIDSGQLPESWKLSYIIPLHKKHDKCNVENYRPISITSILCKTLERIIVVNLNKFLIKNNLINENQFGFLKFRSTNTNLIVSFEDWYEAISIGNKIDVIYIDFKKAFDSINIEILLSKIHNIGVRGKLFNWIKNFLNNRKFQVKIENSLSSEKNISSGVPQGSVLGPLLFLLYINDLPNTITDKVKIKLYADDVKLYMIYKDENDKIHLQNALDQLFKWSELNLLEISLNKCFSFYLGPKNLKTDYFINGSKVNYSSTIRDLGIVIDEKLTFKMHISKIVRNAYFKCYQLFRVIRTRNPIILTNLYKTYVRSQLEYAPEIWNPNQKLLIAKIEKVQKYFTRCIFAKCNKPYVNYQERLKFLKLDTLELRRKILDLTMFYKIYTGMVHLNSKMLMSPLNRPSRRHNYQIYIKQKTNKSANSFINRNNNLWNNLDNYTIESKSIRQFKLRLKEFLIRLNSR
jgi:hypothetical protein